MIAKPPISQNGEGKKEKVFLSKTTRGVSYCGLTIYIEKYLKKAKGEELWKLKYLLFTI
jgi:hypothetical protein